jgi:hypothetical protein
VSPPGVDILDEEVHHQVLGEGLEVVVLQHEGEPPQLEVRQLRTDRMRLESDRLVEGAA